MQAKWVFLLIASVLVPVVFYLYDYNFHATSKNKDQSVATIDYKEPESKKIMEPGAQFAIQTIAVRDGFIYNILLENDQWIEAKLVHATKEEATAVAVDFLKKAKKPSVILYRQMDKYWLVDIFVDYQDERQSLVEVFKNLGLAF